MTTRFVRKKLSLGLGRPKIHHVNDQGETPLFKHVRAGNLNMVAKLVQSGAIIYHRNFNGQTIVHLACIRGHAHILAYLISIECRLNDCDVSGSTPLQAALVPMERECGVLQITVCRQKGLKQIVHCLIEAGADLDIMDKAGQTALQTAISYNGALLGSYDIPRVLVVQGADVNVGDSTRGLHSPFFLSCVPVHHPEPFYFSATFVTLLVAAGADLKSESWLKENSTKLLVHLKPDFLSALREAATLPPTLQNICRLSLRKILRYKLHNQINRLPLANRLKDFLKMEEFIINDIHPSLCDQNK